MTDDIHRFLPGQMMSTPLLISAILQRADRYFGDVEVVSQLSSGGTHRYTYRDCHRRARQLAAAMVTQGMRMGDRVGTLAWNSYRHLEAYYAVAGAGSVLHTLNPRLFQEQIVYMVNHAQDGWLLFDPAFARLVQAIAPHCPGVKGWIALCGRDEMPQMDGMPALLCYEELLRTPLRACATHRAQRAIPRVFSTLTDPPSCMPCRPRCPILSGCRRGTWSAPSSRCFTSTPGGCLMRRR
ncbi:acyl-CoA synthetase (AMP-forming)/AMP-acid ligase II [Variovorax paradoxus]|uniref:Acyl-CoA synthetase (AMP-forming)/AMP-acid ligase II n=1 Tax=Variovorax paradoxus TaxID=34073 RepID=A0AAW8EGW7_VARPD|nr:acyl-CoA synthetase (AMP-forming)/AMP-acid ligase II [Variovorax paradoxus]